MTREKLIQTPEYWKTLYENECERLGIEPHLVFIDGTLTEKPKQEVLSMCAEGLSEDVNGEFYQLYDASKLYDLAYEQGRKSANSNTCSN